MINIDAIVKAPFVTMDLFHELNRLQPFGAGNPAPVFAMKEMKIHKVFKTGADGRHMRMNLTKDKKYFDAIGFGMGDCANDLAEGDFVDVVFGLDLNAYRDTCNLQLVLRDIRRSENAGAENGQKA